MSGDAILKLLTWALAASLALVLAWTLIRRWIKKVSFVRITIKFRDREHKGRPSAKVIVGFWFLYEHEENFVCYETHPVRGATWVSVETGRELSIFDPLYNKLNDAARKEQLKHESNHD